MILTIGEPGDSHDPTQLWPSTREELKVGTLSISSVAPQEDAACNAVNFDPLVLSDGIQPTNDPVLLARSPAYAISFWETNGGTVTASRSRPWSGESQIKSLQPSTPPQFDDSRFGGLNLTIQPVRARLPKSAFEGQSVVAVDMRHFCRLLQIGFSNVRRSRKQHRLDEHHRAAQASKKLGCVFLLPTRQNHAHVVA
jgi:hypothetical protein